MAGLRVFVLALSVGINASAAVALDGVEVGDLVRISVANGPAIIGEVLEHSKEQTKLLNIKTLKPLTINADNQGKAPQVLSGQEAISAVGLPTYFAWQIQRNVKSQGTGKVAEVTATAVYVTIPRKAGVEVGQQLRVMRDQGAIKDPDTGEVLSAKRTTIATLQVTEVEERLCKSKRSDSFETEIFVGDIVEVVTPPRKIAILPLAAAAGDGSATATAQRFTEQMTTKLVELQVPVVERSQLDKILGEVSLQQTKWFEPEAAAKVGKQLGAFAVLTGSLVPQGKVLQANVRLVRVDTGEILASGSAPLQKLVAAPNNGRATPAAISRQPQGVWAKPVNLKPPYRPSYKGAPTDHMSLQYAVLEILGQVGLKYDFNASLRNASQECRTFVTPNFQGKPCRVALEELLAPFPLTYEVDGDTVTLKHK